MKEKEVLQAVVVLIIAIFLVQTLISFYKGSMMSLIVLSGSMTPLMLPGDMIIEKSVDPSELKVGDVIAFHPPGNKSYFVTHRIISLEEGKKRMFQTKGDANNAQDDFKVPASNVVGKLIFVIPFVGYLPDTVKHNKNILLFTVILPAGLIILDEIRNIIKYSDPVNALKIERKQKKAVRRTSHIIKRKRLIALVFITSLIFTGVFLQNLRENGPVVLGGENKVENTGALPSVYVFTSADSEQKLAIEPWYGVVSSANSTQVIAPENTSAKLSMVPYILPVFWITILAGINPYLPVTAGILFYVSFFTLLLFPLWYRKSAIGERRKKIRAHQLLLQCKRALNMG